MEFSKLACPSCGGSIQLPKGINRINCSYCGTHLQAQHGEGNTTLEIVEQVTQTIQEVGTETQSAIKEGTQVAQSELKRLQLGQDLSIAQMQLSNIQSEIRTLERERRTRKIKRQLEELRINERDTKDRIRALQAALSPSVGQTTSIDRKSEGTYPISILEKVIRYAIGMGRGFLYGMIVLVAGVMLIPSNLSTASAQYDVLLLIILSLSLITFLYFRRPDAGILGLISKVFKIFSRVDDY
jgi:LSD1 subclass zinc finger protein